MGTKIQIASDDVTGFQLIPEGKWTARLVDVNEGESNSGNPKLEWEWEMVDGLPGAEITIHASLQENALGMNKEIFTAFGVTWKAGDDLEKIARKKFIKKKAVLMIIHDQFNHRETGERMSSNKVAHVYNAKTPTGSAEAGSGGGGVQDDDEIPF